MRTTLTAAAVALLGAALALAAQPPSTAPPEGLRDNTPAVHALVNARLVLAPGRTIEKGTVVVRDGTVVAVGSSADVTPPADARVWDLAGKTVYPGLIDAYGEASDGPARGGSTGSGAGRGEPAQGPSQGQELLRAASPTGGAAYWNPRVTPQFRADQQYRPDAETNRKLRGQGVV